jgi:hypothetical protein
MIHAALFLVLAAPPDAVVQLPSHGGSGTIVWTAQGQSYVLTAGHMFDGGKRNARIQVTAPDPRPGAARPGGARLVGTDPSADLALVELHAGPLPYVCPIAPAGHTPGRLLSVGYDEMHWPAQKRSAHVIAGSFTRTCTLATAGPGRQILLEDPGNFLTTQELPWHGRSGGGLIDIDNGYLIGVVSGYRGTDPRHWQEVKPGASGVYVAPGAIRRFVTQYAPGILQNPYQYRPPIQNPQMQNYLLELSRRHQGLLGGYASPGYRYYYQQPYAPPGQPPYCPPGGT